MPSQVVSLKGTQYLRVEARDVPSVGYKVFEIQSGAGEAFSGAPTADAATGVMENERYRLTVSGRGAITSLVDKQLGGRELVGTTGGYGLNDLGPGSGTCRSRTPGRSR